MDKDILATITDAEKEIRELLVAERARAGERLAQVRREAEAEVAGEEERQKQALREALALAGAEAERKAAALLEEAAAWAERLDLLDEESLQRIVARRLAELLPGKEHDRQNGED